MYNQTSCINCDDACKENTKYFTAAPMQAGMGIFIIVLGYQKPYSS
jgi:hypothetical protein